MKHGAFLEREEHSEHDPLREGEFEKTNWGGRLEGPMWLGKALEVQNDVHLAQKERAEKPITDNKQIHHNDGGIHYTTCVFIEHIDACRGVKWEREQDTHLYCHLE